MQDGTAESKPVKIYSYAVQVPLDKKMVRVNVQDGHEYYKHFSFGITLSHKDSVYDRINGARELLNQMTMWYPEIPVSIIFNRCKKFPYPKLPKEFYADNITLKITDGLISFGRCQNLHAIAYPKREYVICFGDKDRIRFDKVLDVVIMQHIINKADLVRGFYSTAFSIFKKALAELSWWDERYYHPWNDVDMEKRLIQANIPQAALTPHIFFTRVPVSVPTYYRLEKLEGFGSKENGIEFHHMKWGDDCNPNIPVDRKAKLPEIDWYPDYTEQFKNHQRLWE